MSQSVVEGDGHDTVPLMLEVVLAFNEYNSVVMIHTYISCGTLKSTTLYTKFSIKWLHYILRYVATLKNT